MDILSSKWLEQKEANIQKDHITGHDETIHLTLVECIIGFLGCSGIEIFKLILDLRNPCLKSVNKSSIELLQLPTIEKIESPSDIIQGTQYPASWAYIFSDPLDNEDD